MIRAIWSRLLDRFLPKGLHGPKSPEELAQDRRLWVEQSRLTMLEGPPKRVLLEVVTCEGDRIPLVFATQAAHRLSDDLLRGVAILERPREQKRSA
jgi:hypothetical protein